MDEITSGENNEMRGSQVLRLEELELPVAGKADVN